MTRDLTDPTDQWWTISQAAAHLRVRRRTIRDYIRAGVRNVTIAGIQVVHRDELLAEYRRRLNKQRDTHFTGAQ